MASNYTGTENACNSAVQRLMEAIRRTGAPIVAGLDPRLADIPAHIREAAVKEAGPGLEGAAAAITAFNRGLIDALKDVIPAVKPQMAYYEQYGWAGVKAYEDTARYAKEAGLIVICDGKRNDIGSTAEAYAAGYLGRVDMPDGTESPSVDADWLTVNGYLGSDGIKPFTKACKEYGKGIFVLIRTSNPSAGELQDLRLADTGETVYQRMAKLVGEWGTGALDDSGWSSVGAVVGATYPREAAELRALLPKTMFLVPGYGAQGAGADDVAVAFDADGCGAIVNSSRGIMSAYKAPGSHYGPEGYAEAARAAAQVMRDDIAKALNSRR